jgi:hypothetical protein
MKPILLGWVVFAMGLVSCTSLEPAVYQSETPRLSLENYFNGPLEAHGMLSDRSGKVTRRFVVNLVGRWQGEEGVLEEDFVWSDGEKQRRVWRLKRVGEGRYEGRADDVEGVAVGEVAGNAFRMKYVLQVPVGEGEKRKVYSINVDDWMYLIDERVMLNRSVMSKFGFRVGEVTLSFMKPSP